MKHNQIKSEIEGVILHDLPLFSDNRGHLSFGEFEKGIPFVAKRYFVIFGVPKGEVRGEHAHRNCHQFLICVKGSCYISVDDGKKKEEHLLDSPNRGIHLSPMIWGAQYKFSVDSVLVVFVTHYIERLYTLLTFKNLRLNNVSFLI